MLLSSNSRCRFFFSDKSFTIIETEVQSLVSIFVSAIRAAFHQNLFVYG